MVSNLDWYIDRYYLYSYSIWKCSGWNPDAPVFTPLAKVNLSVDLFETTSSKNALNTNGEVPQKSAKYVSLHPFTQNSLGAFDEQLHTVSIA